MSTLRTQLVTASYAGLRFPVLEFDDSCGHAHKAHSAWRVPGADIETTGREPLRTKMRIGLLTTMTGQWAGEVLFPDRFDELVRVLAEQPQGDLWHPLYGLLRAQVATWSYKGDPTCQQGVYLEVDFLEIAATAALPMRLEAEPGEAMTAAAGAADDAVGALTTKVPATAPVVAEQLAYLEDDTRSAGEAYGALGQVQSAVAAALVHPDLAGPEGHDARAQLRALDAATWAYAERYLQPKPQARTHTVLAPMSLARVAALVYGDPSKATALRRANVIPDELFVPAGTTLKVPDDA